MMQPKHLRSVAHNGTTFRNTEIVVLKKRHLTNRVNLQVPFLLVITIQQVEFMHLMFDAENFKRCPACPSRRANIVEIQLYSHFDKDVARECAYPPVLNY